MPVAVALIAIAATVAGTTGTAAAAPARAAHARPIHARPSLLSLEAQFMCVSCHEPLELVSSPQAQAEKGYIAGLIAAGDTASQIRANMVVQYGDAVLGRPPASGFNLLIYVLPPALLLLGAAGLIYTLPKWRARSRRAAATPLTGAPPLEAGEARRLDDELARFV